MHGPLYPSLLWLILLSTGWHPVWVCCGWLYSVSSCHLCHSLIQPNISGSWATWNKNVPVDYERCLRNHFSKKKIVFEMDGYIQCETFATYIYIFICMLCFHCWRVPCTHTLSHICHFILCSFIHPFILTLINLLGIWLRMLPLGQVKAEYTFFWKINFKKTPSLHFTPFLTLCYFFSSCGTHHPIEVGALVCVYTQTIRRHTALFMYYVYYSRCIENVSSEMECVPRCQGITSTLNFNKF